MKQLITLVFGERAEGEPLPQPSFKTTYPAKKLEEAKWAKKYKVGSRYGHRGSFYENKPSVIKLATP